MLGHEKALRVIRYRISRQISILESENGTIEKSSMFCSSACSRSANLPEGVVAKVTENMTKLNSEDLKVIAFQLKSAPAIPNKVTKK